MSPRFALRQDADAAFEALYRRHVHDVYRYALAVLGSPSDAEDVTQTAFLNAYRAYQRGERPRKAGPWLRTIAHNVCRQRFRQASRRPREVGIDHELADDFGVEETEGPSPQDIARALKTLPFNQRSALVMRELEGLSQAEIAEALELSVSAVETVLFRARRALREQLEHSLTCGEAARAISRQLTSSTSRSERAALRAHLRECPECATFARQARAQRKGLKRLAMAPLPSSLLTWSGATGAGVAASAAAPAAGVGVKLAAGLAVTALAVGAGERGVRQLADPPARPASPTAPARHAGEVARAGAGAGAPAGPGARGGAAAPRGHAGPPTPDRLGARPHGAAGPRRAKPPRARRDGTAPRHASPTRRPRDPAPARERPASSKPPRERDRTDARSPRLPRTRPERVRPQRATPPASPGPARVPLP